MKGKGNSQVVPARNGAGAPWRGRALVAPRFSRYLRQMAAAGSGLAILSVMVLSPVAAAPASAVSTAWYAYVAGAATGTPSACPQTTTPSQQCTLAEALAAAAAGGAIYLATPGGTGIGAADYVGNWTVSTSGTSALQPLTIEPASGVANPTLDGNGGSSSSPCSTSACDGPVLTVSSSAFVDIDGLTFQNADNTSPAPYGGAIQNDAGGTLTISDSTFTGNTAADGGAVANGYTGTATLSVSGSTFSANTATADGGAISSGEQPGSTATLVVTGSTFSDNRATNDDGGAIDSGDYQATATLTVIASTFSSNTANQDGGTGIVWAAADIFSGGCDQAAGTWDDEGYNVASDATCFGPAPASTDNDSAGTGLGSLLGSLANNGGPTETVLPLPGNPALSIVPNGTSVSPDGTSATLCPATDQRGVASEPGQACDAGSVQEGLPVALAQSFSTVEGTELTEPAGTLQSGLVDDNPGASSWTAELTATATDGTVVVHPDGSFTYTPTAGFIGTDLFSYTLADNLGYVSAPAMVTLMVSSVPPTSTTTIASTTTTLTSTAVPTVVPVPPTMTTPPTDATSPPKPFPHSGQSYPNGAIVSFAGHDYVFAGGRAFLGSPSELAALRKVDYAKVSSAPVGMSAPTSTVPRSGTLLTTRAVNGNATVYFAGTDGELHGFSTGHQLSSDGYDIALVVTVPSLGGLEVGSAAGADGSAASALSTRADGAIVNSSGMYYVFAGGRAFGISSPSVRARVQKADKAKVLVGSVGAAEKGAAIAGGVLLSVPGTVYVSYSGALYTFKTTTQLDHDGYGGTTAVPVPGTAGLSVVSSYSGS